LIHRADQGRRSHDGRRNERRRGGQDQGRHQVGICHRRSSPAERHRQGCRSPSQPRDMNWLGAVLGPAMQARVTTGASFQDLPSACGWTGKSSRDCCMSDKSRSGNRVRRSQNTSFAHVSLRQQIICVRQARQCCSLQDHPARRAALDSWNALLPSRSVSRRLRWHLPDELLLAGQVGCRR